MQAFERLVQRQNALFAADAVANPLLRRMPQGGSGLTDALTYNADRLMSGHNCEFLLDPRFQHAYAAGMATATDWLPKGTGIEWRVHTCCWAGMLASQIPGDFVECGVNTGIYTTALLNYIGRERLGNKQVWLFDTYNGVPLQGLGRESAALAVACNEVFYHQDVYEQVRAQFAALDNVHVIRGVVPDSLTTVDIQQVAYLSIDMNVMEPEVMALAHFWDLMSPGAVCVLDDYAFAEHHRQKTAIDELVRGLGVEVLTMPTGQGLIIHP